MAKKRTIKLKTSSRNEWLDITSKIQEVITEENLVDGIAVVYTPHTTAAITINEHADPAVQHDIIKKLKELAPERDGYTHTEGNSDGHVKASLIGPSESVIVEEGTLQLGTWQGIFFCEFDGPRNRKVCIKTVVG